MLRFFRSLLAAIITLILALAATLATAAFALHGFADDSLHRIHGILQNRSEALALALGEIGAMGEDPQTMVALSRAMHGVQEHARRSMSDFPVSEVFYLNKKGELMAHSDIAVLAKDSGSDYTDERFGKIVFRPERDPAVFSSMELEKPPLDYLKKGIHYYLQEVESDLLARRYLVSLAVYQQDSLSAAGGLHIIMDNTMVDPLLNLYRTQLLETVRIGIMLSSGLSAVVFFLFLVLFPAGRFNDRSGRNIDNRREYDRDDERDDEERIRVLNPGEGLDENEASGRIPEGVEAFESLYANDDEFPDPTEGLSQFDYMDEDGVEEDEFDEFDELGELDDFISGATDTGPSKNTPSRQSTGQSGAEEFQAINEEFTGPTKVMDAIPIDSVRRKNRKSHDG